MPRVVHLGKFYPPHMGGIETHLQNLCRELAHSCDLAKSCDVEAIVANDGPENTVEWDGQVRVRRVATRYTLASTPVCPGLVAAIRKSKPDLIHLHLPNPLATIALFISGYKGPVVITYHSDVVRQKWLRRIFEPFFQWSLRRSSAILCTSQRYLDSSSAVLPFREKCVVVPYGIPPASAHDLKGDDVDAICRLYGKRLIIGVGRLVYYKGFENLIEAMLQVDGRLLLVGDGPLRTDLQRLIADRGLAEKVILLGEIQNERLLPYYYAADVFAFPSVARSEAFGIVQLEAMQCGLPVVNTDLDSGVPFVSRHEETGLTVPAGDISALAAALNRLLSDPDLRSRFANAARNRVHTEFTADLMARRTSQIYNVLLENRTHACRASPDAIRSVLQ